MRDPTTVAVEVTAIKGQMALLARDVSQGLGNVSSQLAAVQGDLRDVERSLSTVASQQHEIQSHSSGLERLAKAIESHVDENNRWRSEHSAGNQVVADRVTGHQTGIRVSWVLFLVLSSVVAAWTDAQFRRVDERMADHIASSNDAKRIIEQRMDRMDTERARMMTEIREAQDTRSLK